MPESKIARGWFALTALAALTGLVTQVIATSNVAEGRFATAAGRVANLLCFFTIDSNVLVTITTALLALGLARTTGLFPVLWLCALVGITVTGVVYQVALAGLYELHGLALFADTMLHKVSPIMCVLGWLLCGPRGLVRWSTVWWSLLYPLAWVTFTLIRGAIIDYYPYPFIDATKLGYGRITLNCAIIGLFFIALAIGALGLDRLFTRRADAKAVAKTPAQPEAADAG
ncbi:Pr6Pr family membrane protein [Amycolatopsis sp. NPDC059027]|uniref:Pr6Pr family membrane protein n=1 Tax=Amycolatopsis sp. NPDC059027 TaxID=3346709 RepID=UPI00366E1D71